VICVRSRSGLPSGGLIAKQRTGTVMHYTNGWMGGGMWLWTVVGVLVVVLLAVVIGKQSKQ
jgi:uncharacterized membrane protein